jgi:hypothetical protein
MQHAAAGDPPIDLKVPGIEANLTHHNFELGDAFEARAVRWILE